MAPGADPPEPAANGDAPAWLPGQVAAQALLPGRVRGQGLLPQAQESAWEQAQAWARAWVSAALLPQEPVWEPAALPARARVREAAAARLLPWALHSVQNSPEPAANEPDAAEVQEPALVSELAVLVELGFYLTRKQGRIPDAVDSDCGFGIAGQRADCQKR